MKYLINTLEISKIEYEKQRETTNNSSEVEERNIIKKINSLERKEKVQGKTDKKIHPFVIRKKLKGFKCIFRC